MHEFSYRNMSLIIILATAIISIIIAFIGVALSLRRIRVTEGQPSGGKYSMSTSKLTTYDSSTRRRLTPPGVGRFLSRMLHTRLMGMKRTHRTPQFKRQRT
jgi:hypothetical protein